ncbi:bifunctional 4-hydroxy-2-oxoglutarate aldolase/2-dehydro-3-deoxy-phosphogluconate aldolase [Actibacterium sp. XHP0104]|uniref:bifunctional 4-hydroxy-2-oxoglutarate aldolase/2-dehydro-3-deoxy-phosphogluconate aldolase n=1 Tax=Actibacterium sp. XHP0104 TaxID=2984335 RepID=UPI0021E9276E|nr:bifunctional 4-hydroxy-2-oxoglutarate aldolase/2-dehydro-3-deoxy-phosphogluconate aldolase [Actibacterium sp. XHP0104]MCV2880903.1 bifunctional 4-hydroxy-2-oxoglutarate aldolase/2-dehydro-3-deoxy-phosphogluconate aldolase [Actibacterium sp. XHP0104]
MTPFQASKKTAELCRMAPVIPVLVVEDPAHARPLAEALVAGGLPVLEVTLRTPAALEVIAEMATVKGGIVGAGTVLCPDDAYAAKDAGARFAVTPGCTSRLLDAVEDAGLPTLPGAATPSEVLSLLEQGYSVQKFFPAEINGGIAALKAIGAPMPQVTFCPTGGVSATNAPDYLALPNVACVGGSWVAPKALVEAGDWGAITDLARAAAALGR